MVIENKNIIYQNKMSIVVWLDRNNSNEIM